MDSTTTEECKNAGERPYAIPEEEFHHYIALLWGEARRAWEEYHILVIPGAEITNDSKKYHILGVDIKDYVSPDLSVGEIVNEVHRQGGIAIACHPHKRNGYDE